MILTIRVNVNINEAQIPVIFLLLAQHTCTSVHACIIVIVLAMPLQCSQPGPYTCTERYLCALINGILKEPSCKATVCSSLLHFCFRPLNLCIYA